MTETPPPGDPYGQQPPPGQPPYGPAYGQQPVQPFGEPPRKGFFGALFDFSFDHFVTPMLVKVVYILAVVGLVLGWLFWLVAGFNQSTGLGVAVLVLGPLLMLVYLCLVRMTLEFYLAVTRMSQEVHQRLR